MAEPLTSATLVATLLERVPAFASARSEDQSFMSHKDDSTYLCFGDLGLFLSNLLCLESHTSEEARTIAESFALLNEMGNSSDPEVANIAVVNVFEVLTNRPESLTAARRYLKDQAANEFERMVSRFSSHD